MRPTRSAIGLRCLVKYWANVIVRADGSVKSATTSPLFSGIGTYKSEYGLDRLSAHSQGNAWLGPPHRDSPDQLLYLNVERPTHYLQPDLGLCGRIDGEIVGSVGVLDVLRVLIRSLDEYSECSGHSSFLQAYNCPVSLWMSDKQKKNGVFRNMHIYPGHR